MARSRADIWLRDEAILALDLYMREGVNASSEDRQALSDTLRAIPVEPELATNAKFRSRASVSYKLANFEAINPNTASAGFENASSVDRDVWEEFGDDPDRLADVAAAIRANLDAIAPADAEADEPDITDAPEGTVLTRMHRVRERSAKLVNAKKASALKEHGKLTCEGCGFDFAATYGSHGDGFIECHHTKPVHTLRKGQRTNVAELVLVCSNCHRMIHRRAQWLTMDELRGLLAT
jgi:5-methylcytosine-specific restriction protein A